MSLDITYRLNNLAAQAEHVLSDFSQTQIIIFDVVDTQQPSEQALGIQPHTEAGVAVVDAEKNIRHVFSVYPRDSSLYFNPSDPTDRTISVLS